MEQPWISETLRQQDRDYSGPLLPEMVAEQSGTAWRQVALTLVQPELAKIAPPSLPAAWMSDRLTFGQSHISHWLWTRLADGRLRASGRKGDIPGAPHEWIPREQWESLTDIRQGNAWRHLFRQLDAFNLHAGEPAWCDVRVVVAKVPDKLTIATTIQSANPIWPDNQAGRNVPTSGQEKRLVRWLLENYSAHPGRTKSIWEKIARDIADFRNLSKSAFIRAWQELTKTHPEAKKAGRPRKKIE